MKERPILLKGDMVRATLDDRKTHTRRVIIFELNYPHVTGTPPEQLLGDWALSEVHEIKNGYLNYEYQTAVDDSCLTKIKCPYGVPGDQLWVRETWKPVINFIGYTESRIKYRADDSFLKIQHSLGESDKWKPSIFMPRWASRIQLEIMDIRIERIQDISGEDAAKEGVPCTELGLSYETELCKAQFIDLWESINHKRGFGWDVNPWVWVVEFKRIKP